MGNFDAAIALCVKGMNSGWDPALMHEKTLFPEIGKRVISFEMRL